MRMPVTSLSQLMRGTIVGPGRVTLATTHRQILKDRINQANRRSADRYAWPTPARTVGPRWVKQNM